MQLSSEYRMTMFEFFHKSSLVISQGGELVRAYIVKADRITEQEVAEIIAGDLFWFKYNDNLSR